MEAGFVICAVPSCRRGQEHHRHRGGWHLRYTQPVQAQQIPLQVQGNLILEAGQFTRYMGDKAIGVVTGQGFVDVYDDRIEFRKTSGSSDTGEGNKAISISFRDLNWFSGYWTYEDSYSSDSFYLEPINDHQVYAVIGDEAAATHYGIVLDVVSDPSRSTISLYYPDGNRFDSINGTNINGTDAITMSDYNGVLFRTDKSVRAQEYWDHINDLFKGANEWYD